MATRFDNLIHELLDVRGPPERRFWKIQWANGLTDGDPDKPDDGSFACDWQPDENISDPISGTDLRK
eukprot:SAG31_NODE_2069_length_6520_cov_9.531226_1_plen_67_part_00